MVSELLCLDIIQALYGRTSTVTRTFDLDEKEPPKVQIDRLSNALLNNDLIRPLLLLYELHEIDAAIRWLQLGEYITITRYGLTGLWLHVLTEKGITVAKSKRFADDERSLFYLAEPYQVFVAHQFNSSDSELVRFLCQDLLRPNGYTSVDGRVDGLEEFRHAILTKIRKSRFFICLLTGRARLESGKMVSSVWLYQEIGAAVALGRSPLILVEDGLDSHYAGELQKTYEFIPFTRLDYVESFQPIIRRLDVDLQRAGVPLPTR